MRPQGGYVEDLRVSWPDSRRKPGQDECHDVACSAQRFQRVEVGWAGDVRWVAERGAVWGDLGSRRRQGREGRVQLLAEDDQVGESVRARDVLTVPDQERLQRLLERLLSVVD